MTKDYKDVPRRGERRSKERRKSGASNAAKRSEKKALPNWLMLLGAASVGGIVVAGAMYLLLAPDAQPKSSVVPEVVASSKKTEPKSAEQKSDASSHDSDLEDDDGFDFYTLLPKLEVIIPESEIKEEQEKHKPKEDVAYMIQVGSFRSFVEAEALKAQLAFLGIEADIEAISSKGETWQRVRVGPFSEKRELNRIRNRLHSNDYNTMLVKIKTEQG